MYINRANMFSVVQYYFDNIPQSYTCGYCKRRNAYKRHGMWAHTLTVQDYQSLIDRGWRRSGSYCYKPMNDQTCCPLYTIKCAALNFTVSKSQKKIIKKVAKFFKDGRADEEHDATRSKRSKKFHQPTNDIDFCNIMEADFAEHTARAHTGVLENDYALEQPLEADETMAEEKCDKIGVSAAAPSSKLCDDEGKNRVQPMVEDPKDDLSAQVAKKFAPMPKFENDSSLPRKAKLIRIERAKNRLLARGKTLEEIEAIYKNKKERTKAKSLDELLNSIVNGANKLELKLVRVSSEEFMDTLDESAELFKKYQIAVHNDEPHEWDKSSFLSFLGKSPLQHFKAESGGPPLGYGSFHQQYWLNNKLMAVGVIDILPSCVSSVYFFYDPVYSFLSLGSYSSLMEVRLVRELNKVAPDLKYYYMGYYIHTIPKMKYKAKMRPSMLLCPETYQWYDIDHCIKKLDINKYSRFNDDLDAIDEDGIVNTANINQVRVYYRGRRLYRDTRNIRQTFGDTKDDSNEVKEYVELVGKKCSRSMYLVRS